MGLLQHSPAPVTGLEEELLEEAFVWDLIRAESPRAPPERLFLTTGAGRSPEIINPPFFLPFTGEISCLILLKHFHNSPVCVCVCGGRQG